MQTLRRNRQKLNYGGVKNHLLEEAMVPVDKTITIANTNVMIGEFLLVVGQGVEIVVMT